MAIIYVNSYDIGGIFGMNEYRYYKGEIQLLKLTDASPMKTCAYYIVEENDRFPVNSIQVIPYRLCWRNKKIDT